MAPRREYLRSFPNRWRPDDLRETAHVWWRLSDAGRTRLYYPVDEDLIQHFNTLTNMVAYRHNGKFRPLCTIKYITCTTTLTSKSLKKRILYGEYIFVSLRYMQKTENHVFLKKKLWTDENVIKMALQILIMPTFGVLRKIKIHAKTLRTI